MSQPAAMSGKKHRRVALAAMAGTTIEWYDFFIYALCAALVFNTEFFAALGDNALLLSFATIGLSFFFRPVGAALAGHLGDRIGRRNTLILTLLLMGASTTLIGLLPPASAIGAAAPVLLVLLRILQGLSAGGEWGGAALLAAAALAPPRVLQDRSRAILLTTCAAIGALRWSAWGRPRWGASRSNPDGAGPSASSRWSARTAARCTMLAMR